MKPLTLDIAGLNGFRSRQTVDFGRLLDHGIFGIFGPTGSGKSSVLDAMTLALYGKVKRAANGKAGVINLQEKTCTVSLTFEMGTDGERRRYTVERSLGRASGRPDGVTTRRARLIEHADEASRVLAEKQSEIDRHIVDLLGIEYDEFLRAVVLPQGSFAEFLGLTPAERSRALQRLFGLSELGQRLSGRLKRVADDVKGSRQEIEGRLAELRKFDDDALAAARARAEEASSDEAAARAALAEAERAHAEAAALSAACAERDALLSGSDERAAFEAESAALRGRLERAERAASVATPLELREEATARLTTIRSEYAAAVERRLAAEESLARVRGLAARAREQHAKSYATLTSQALELDTVATGQDRLAESKAQQDLGRTALVTTEETLGQRERELTKATEEATRIENDIAESEEQITTLAVPRDLLDKLGRQRDAGAHLRTLETSLSETRKSLEQQVELIRESERELDALRGEHGRCEAELVVLSSQRLPAAQACQSLEERRATLLGRWQALKETLAAVERDENECVRLENDCRSTRAVLEAQQTEWSSVSMEFSATGDRVMELDEARLAAFETLQEGYRRLAVATLAPHLHDGEPCPLCGATEHPGGVAVAGADDAELARLKAAHEAAELAFSAALRMKENVAVRMESARTRLDGATDSLTRDERALQHAQRRLKEALVAVGEERELASVSDLRRYLEETRSEGTAVKEEEERWAVRLRDIDERMEGLRSTAADRDKACAKIEGELAQRRRECAETSEREASLTATTGAARRELHEQSGGRELEEIGAELERLLDADRAVEALRTTVIDKRQQLAALRSEREALSLAVNELTRNRDVQRSQLNELDRQLTAREAELARRFEAVTIEAERATDARDLARRRSEQAAGLARALGDAEAQLQEAQTEERVAATTVSGCWDRQCAAERDAELRDRELTAVLARAGFASAGEAEEARLEQHEVDVARTRIAEIDDHIRTAARRLAELEGVIGGRSIVASEMTAFATQLERAKSAAEAAIGESAAARSALSSALESNAEYHRVVDADAGYAGRARTIEQLGRYLHGDAFINYLADEKLADVCVRASRLLQDLTSGRLALTSRPSVGFVINDFANGAERSPASLSGGETFLVSLALALALSDTIQLGRSPLEFFFLDEGFGTLDEDLLETVVGALERLRSQHRTIGLITHVAMLRERIPRRLVITAPTPTCGSTIAYEVG